MKFVCGGGGVVHGREEEERRKKVAKMSVNIIWACKGWQWNTSCDGWSQAIFHYLRFRSSRFRFFATVTDLQILCVQCNSFTLLVLQVLTFLLLFNNTNILSLCLWGSTCSCLEIKRYYAQLPLACCNTSPVIASLLCREGEEKVGNWKYG